VSGLAEEREFLLQSIRDLDAELAAGDLDPEDHRRLRDEYTARAAEVLRQMEGAGEPSAAAQAAPPAAARSGRGRSKALVAVVVAALLSGGAGYAVATSSNDRLQTDEATGSIELGSTDRITRAQQLVSQGKVLQAVRVYDELIAEDPENPVALAQKGWLLVQVGEPSLVDSGLASIDRAIAAEPTYADAYFFKGMTLLRAKGDPALARQVFEQGLATNPPPDVRTGLEEGIELADEMAAEAGASATP
jgi:tetratricopeptide (TPR) repeat protein